MAQTDLLTRTAALRARDLAACADAIRRDIETVPTANETAWHPEARSARIAERIDAARIILQDIDRLWREGAR